MDKRDIEREWATEPSLSGSSASSMERPFDIWARAVRQRAMSRMRKLDRIYMPFSLFEDCNVGSAQRRKEALWRNKERKSEIMPFMAAWALRGSAMASGLVTSGNIQKLGVDTTFLQAGFGVALVMCMACLMVLWVGWLGLVFFQE